MCTLFSCFVSKSARSKDKIKAKKGKLGKWIVGNAVIFQAELFYADDLTHVLSSFPKLLGTPDESSLKFLRSDNARRYVKQLPQFPKQNFATRFPSMSPLALDLLRKMLMFDPSQRITGKDCSHMTAIY